MLLGNLNEVAIGVFVRNSKGEVLATLSKRSINAYNCYLSDFQVNELIAVTTFLSKKKKNRQFLAHEANEFLM